MERIIQTLLDIDTAGQKLVRDAEDVKRIEQERMDKYKHDMYKRYVMEEKERIEKYKKFAGQERERQIEELKSEFAQKRVFLNGVYEKNADAWTDEIVKRCIGR